MKMVVVIIGMIGPPLQKSSLLPLHPFRSAYFYKSEFAIDSAEAIRIAESLNVHIHTAHITTVDADSVKRRARTLMLRFGISI